MGQQPGVEIKPDGGNLAVLLGPQQFSRAANFQIAHGDAETGAQIAGLGDGLQPLIGVGIELVVFGRKQVGVGLHRAPTNAPAQLIQLGQPHPVGPVDDNCIDVGHVQPALDDGRTHQHVELAGHEADHDPLKLTGTHLTVSHFYPRIRHNVAQPVGFLLDALQFGAPPHGGIALGIDRWVMLFGGLDNIRDCIAFPKTQRATDMMTGAPSLVDPRQLTELGVRTAVKPQTPGR
ncbi:MAG: hypothetical protein KDA42_06310 [Planctomycetales bacterium]|nr:hypothetical protein [Planctomycetales bacterium]